MSIIAVFVCSFGVTAQATLYPNNNLTLGLLRKVINKAYWPIFGEMRILEVDLYDDECEDSDEGCPDFTGVIFSYIMLMIYMIIANVLLINLLIAMFR
jgi:transient receptor potential cation channel subfamily M protein 3